jgi:hypothetical protein
MSDVSDRKNFLRFHQLMPWPNGQINLSGVSAMSGGKLTSVQAGQKLENQNVR